MKEKFFDSFITIITLVVVAFSSFKVSKINSVSIATAAWIALILSTCSLILVCNIYKCVKGKGWKFNKLDIYGKIDILMLLVIVTIGLVIINI